MSETTFEDALQLVISRERPVVRGGKVRIWRQSLSDDDRSAFDQAVDEDWRVTTADLHRAVVRAGGTDIRYHDVWSYRASVHGEAQR